MQAPAHLMKKILIVLLSIFNITFLVAQNVTISGVIKDKTNGETLIGASLAIEELKGVGTATNEYGFFSLSMPKGNYHLNIKYVGYNTQRIELNMDANKKLDIDLESSEMELKAVAVVAKKTNDNINETQIGVEKLNISEINKLPVLFGERDILKSIQLLPGVKSAGEGRTGFSVRGGGTDQNLILLDEATVYNPSHLFGFFSTFNSDAIKDVSLYKGTAPAQYGGRASSVLDVKMNEGDKQHYRVSGGIGIISSRLNVEGPIQKNKSSFLFTARRTYADLFLKLSKRPALKDSKLYFYDLNGKMNFQIGKKDRIYISGYYGKDVLGFGSTFKLNWSNGTGTIRWNHIVNDKTFSNTSFIFSDYQTNTTIKAGSINFKIRSEIKDFNAKQELQFFPNPNHNIRLGYQTTYHIITPGEVDASDSSDFNPAGLKKRQSWENALYVNDEWAIRSNFKISYGLRLVSFSALSGDYYSFDASGRPIDTTTYTAGQFAKTYYNAEPRISINYMPSKSTSIKVGYARNSQFLHLLSNSTSDNPVDKWVPCSNIIKPQIADQISLGVFQNIHHDMFEFSIEAYYEFMKNQIDYKDDADIFNNELYEGELLFGKGQAYGIEFLVKKSIGKLTGWIGYTFSRTERLIPGINQNKWYPAKQDRKHDLSVVAMYQASKKVSLAGTWVYYTGNAVTFPSGKYQIQGNTYFLYTERNGYRMPAYHRLDFNVNIDLRKKRAADDTKRRMTSSELAVGCYNVYGRKNAFSIAFQDNKDNPNKTEAVKTYLFQWVPSISWNFKF